MGAAPERKELKAGWKNKVEVQTYTKQDVAKHNTKQDSWIIIHGKVYDVTNYLRDHPGGLDILLEVAGTDATSAYEDVGHSEDAGEIMHGLLVGVLKGGDNNLKANSADVSQGSKITIQRTELDKTPARTDILINHRTELASVSVIAAVLSYALSHYYRLPVPNSSDFHNLTQSPTYGSFTQGFATATLTFVVAGVAGASYLSRVLGASKSFSSYAPHLHSSIPEGSTFRPSGVLLSSSYQKFKLRQKKELSDGIYQFIFDLPTKYSILGLPIGQHVAIKATVDDHSVVRSYTPVSNNRDLGRLELLIRVYEKGLMGNYLRNLPVGDSVEIRGPKGAMKYRRDMSRHIGMVGGGTGITPLFQLIRAICEDEKDDTKVSLIYGNRSESDIMLRGKLDEFARTTPHKFKVHYTLDQPSQAWTGGQGHVTKDLMKEKLPSADSGSKILLCGPPGMVTAVKKNLVDLGFENPGAVSKMSDQIFCF